MEVSIHVTEICNLNCKSCFHMIPISNEPYHWFVGEYICPQLACLAQHKKIVNSLVLMGGEPTLHPNLLSIIYIAREIFSDIPIYLATNGSVLKVFEDDIFIQSLIHNNIIVRVTEYPYSPVSKENYKMLYEILESNSIPYDIISKVDENYHFLIQPFRKEINNDITKRTYCKTHHYCTMLKDYKLWVCHLAAYVGSLKAKFPELDWINVDEGAYIDLRDENVTDEMILEKMGSLSTICKHCVELHRSWRSDDPTEITKWARSEGKKEEWVRE